MADAAGRRAGGLRPGDRQRLHDPRLPRLAWEEYVKFDPKFLRPTEVDELIGDAGKAKDRLGWEATVLPPELAKIMVDADIARLDGAKEGQF